MPFSQFDCLAPLKWPQVVSKYPLLGAGLKLLEALARPQPLKEVSLAAFTPGINMLPKAGYLTWLRKNMLTQNVNAQ